MIITALEIRQKTFLKGFRGYEKEEVDAFLNSISQEWEKMVEMNRELKRKCDVAEQESSKMKSMEASLFRTLRTAEEASTAILAQAELTASSKIADAETTARAMLEDASIQSSRIIQDAESRSKTALLELEAKYKNLSNQVSQLETSRYKLSTELRLVAENTLQYLNTLTVNSDLTTDSIQINSFVQPTFDELIPASAEITSNDADSFFDKIDVNTDALLVEKEQNAIEHVEKSIPLNVDFKVSEDIVDESSEIQELDESKFHTVILVDKIEEESNSTKVAKQIALNTYQEEDDLSFFDMIK